MEDDLADLFDSDADSISDIEEQMEIEEQQRAEEVGYCEEVSCGALENGYGALCCVCIRMTCSCIGETV